MHICFKWYFIGAGDFEVSKFVRKISSLYILRTVHTVVIQQLIVSLI